MSDFLNKITENFNLYTHSQKIIARYMMDNMDAIAFTTLEDLAAEIGVSTTTIIRFARALHYDGYSEMQKDIQKNIKSKVSLPERLTNAVHISNNQLLADTFANGARNIQDTLSSLSEKLLNETVQTLSAAKNIYILGMRSSFSLAYYLFSRLGQLKENVHLLQSTGMIFPEEMLSAKKGDVCIAFIFPRYSKVSLNIISWMKKNGIKVILVTSNQDSSINSYSDILLSCYISGTSFKNSYVAPLCLIDYIVAALAVKDYNKAKHLLEKTEKILNQGYFWEL